MLPISKTELAIQFKLIEVFAICYVALIEDLLFTIAIAFSSTIFKFPDLDLLGQSHIVIHFYYYFLELQSF